MRGLFLSNSREHRLSRCLSVFFVQFLILFFFLPSISLAQNFWSITGNNDIIVINGKLDLPAPLDPTDFIVGNQYGDAQPDDEGNFRIAVLRNGTTVTGAVPLDYTEGENPWIGITCRFPETNDPEGPLLLIDAESTARSITVLHPFFLSPDPYRTDEVLASMDGLSSLDSLASSVEEFWPTDTTPFDNNEVVTNLNALFDDVLGALPATSSGKTKIATTNDSLSKRGYYPNNPNHLTQKDIDPAYNSLDKRVQRQSNPRITTSNLDPIIQSDVVFGESKPEEITAKSSLGNPLDTIHKIIQLNPQGTHTFRNGDSIESEFTINSLDEAFALRNTTGLDPQFAFFSTLGDSDIAVGPANSLYSYIDVFGLIANAITSFIGLGPGPSGMSTVSSTTDAVYINYVFTGKLTSGTDTGEFIYAWENHNTEVIAALCLNLLNGSIDALSVLIDFDEFIGPCTGNAMSAALQNANAALNFPNEDTPEGTYGLVYGVGSTALSTLTTCAIEEATKSVVKAILGATKAVLSSIDIIQKVSKIGSVVDRAVGLSGFPIGPSPTTLFTTPMDTWLIAYGDPWGPKLLSVNGINPESVTMPLATIECGGELTIRGKRLQAVGSIEEPKIFIRDRSGKSIRAEITDFDDSVDNEEPPTQQIIATLPEGVSEIIRVRLTNEIGAVETPDILEIPPVLNTVTSNFFFKPDSGPLLGDAAILIGKGFNPAAHDILIGDRLVTPIQSGTDRTMSVAPPIDLDAGNHEVKLRWRDPVDDVAGDPDPQFIRVLGPPVIDMGQGLEVIGSGTLVVNGKNFGRDTSVTTVSTQFPGLPASARLQTVYKVIDIGTQGDDQLSQIIFDIDEMYSDPNPDTVEPEPVTLELYISTPSGDSNIVEFTMTGSGSTLYLRRMQVPDISLADAFAYTSQGDDAPEGSIEVTWECLGMSTCDLGGEDPVPVIDGACIVNYPDNWGMPGFIDPFGSEGEPSGVEPPPGFPAATGAPCHACDVVGEACMPPVDGPITWEGIPASEIFDDIDIVPGAMNVDLSGLPILKGPHIFFSHSNSPDARIIGGGLVIDGDGTDPDVPRDITINITVEEASSDVITIRNCNGVNLTLEIEGEGAMTGVRIENCKNINGIINGTTISNPLILKDSFDCRFDVGFNDYDTAVTIDGGGRNEIVGNIGVRQTIEGIDISEIQGIGVLLKGGTEQNIIAANIVGNKTAGIMIEDAEDNVIFPNTVGLIDFSNIGPVDDDGTPATNVIGLHLLEGANNNTVSGSFLNNERAILIEGGENNIFTELRFGDDGDPGLSNGTDIEMRGSQTVQPSRNIFFNNNFRNPSTNSIIIDNITEQNLFRQNFFTAEDIFTKTSKERAALAESKGMVPMGDPVALRIVNASRNLQITDNWFDLCIVGVSVENSSDIDFTSNLFTRTQAIGFQAGDSHSLSFFGERICGSVFDEGTQTCFGEFFTQTGMMFSGCSNLQFNNVRVEALGGDGMMFTDPPSEIRGNIRIESPLPGDGSIIVQPPRENDLQPLIEPPTFRKTSSEAVIVRNNLAKGIVIRNGASNISILGAQVSANQQEGIFIDDPGEAITIEESDVTFNAGDGIRMINVDDVDIRIGSPRNGNQISANTGWGINIEDSTDPVIRSNFIVFNGLNSGNQAGGINIERSSDINIGGNGLEDGNLISGNSLNGILISDYPDLSPALPEYQITGNFIGTDFTGKMQIANIGAGISLSGDNTNPNTDAFILNNLIGGNSSAGVSVQQTGTLRGPIITGNTIGLDSTNAIGIANGSNGVELAESNGLIVRSNSILSNSSNGVSLNDSDSNQIIGNTIESNNGSGIEAINDSDGNILELNPSIKGNNLDGIRIGNNSENNFIRRNSITGNSGKGISLINGGNNSIPAPTITGMGITTGALPVFFGIADPTLPDFSIVQLFVDDADEGETFLATTSLIRGTFSFYGVRIPTGVSLGGRSLRATITDLDGNTSEFGEFDPSLNPREPSFPPFEPDELIALVRNDAIQQTRTTEGILTPLTSGNTDSSPATSPLFEEDEFLFVRDIGGSTDIFKSNSQGLTNLTSNSTNDFHPSISNDGTRMAFISDRSGMQALYVSDIDGSNVEQLTFASDNQRHPDWSPDDSQIVFASDESGSLQLHIVEVDSVTTGSIPLTDLAGVNDHPTWNAMTNQIAFEHANGSIQAPGNFQIGVIDPQTFVSKLFNNGTWTDEDPEWVIDVEEMESWLLVSSRDTDNPSSVQSIYIMSDQGALETRVTNFDSDDFDPACCFPEPNEKALTLNN